MPVCFWQRQLPLLALTALFAGKYQIDGVLRFQQGLTIDRKQMLHKGRNAAVPRGGEKQADLQIRRLL